VIVDGHHGGYDGGSCGGESPVGASSGGCDIR
jgi:hypothetical protein